MTLSSGPTHLSGCTIEFGTGADGEGALSKVRVGPFSTIGAQTATAFCLRTCAATDSTCVQNSRFLWVDMFLITAIA